MSPVSRLSMPTTLMPRSSSSSERCEPRNPAAPVTRTLGISVRVLLAEAAENREDEDLDVEQKRPVLDVVEVVLDALLDRGVAAPAVDLRPARHPALHSVAEHVLGDALLELLHEGGPLRPRPDEAHVAQQYVDELGELVEVVLAQEGADWRAARVVGGGEDGAGVLLGVVHHRAELVDLERPTVEGHALLADQDRARPATELDQHADQEVRD